MSEPIQNRNGIGENQLDMVFIASTIGEEMENVPILSTEHVKFQWWESHHEISTENKIISYIDFQSK